MSGTQKVFSAFLALAIGMGLSSNAVQAARYWGITTTGYWDVDGTGGNWLGNSQEPDAGQPGDGDTTTIGFSTVSGGVAQVRNDGEVARGIIIGRDSATAGTLDILSGTLAVGRDEAGNGYITLGDSGTGVINHSGGSVTVGAYDTNQRLLTIGKNSSSSGTYNLSGTGLLTTFDLVFGAGSTALFNQTGGSATIHGGVTSGSGPSELRVDNGTMTVGSGLSVDNLRVGVNNGNTGSLAVNGGAVRVGTGTGTFYLGRRSSGTGVTEGTADFGASTGVAIDVASLQLGTDTTGSGRSTGFLTLSQAGNNQVDANTILMGNTNTGDNQTVASELHLGGEDNVIKTDTFTIGGNKSAGTVDIAAGGTLTLGGKSAAGTDLYISENYINTGTVSKGTLNLSGGTFNATLDLVRIARHGASSGNAEGTLIMDAGTVTANNLEMAIDNGSDVGNTKATLTINGGTITVSGGVTDGGGTSTINVDNGTMTVGNGLSVDSLRVGVNNGNTGSLTVNGGAVRVGTGTETFYLGRRSSGTGVTQGTADFGDSTGVTIDVASLQLGTDTTGSGRSTGFLTLSQDGNNQIDANTILMGNTGTGDNQSVASELHLGGEDNILRTDTFTIGGNKSVGTVDIAAGGTLTLGGNTVAETDLYIGENYINTATVSKGTLDLSGGTFNATLDLVRIARHDVSSGNAEGTLIMNGGTVNANNLEMAIDNGTDVANTNATLAIKGGTFDISGGVTDGGGTSTINVDGGTMTVGSGFAVDNLRVGYNGGTGSLTVSGGAFVVDNGATDVSIGRRDASGSTTSVGTLDLGGTTSVNLDIDDLFIGITNNAGAARGELVLGASNTITADEIRIGDSTSPGQEGITSRIELNGTTSIAANLITIAHRKSTGLVEFGTNGGTLSLGSSSERIGDLRIGYNDHAGTGTNSNGTLDLTGGTATVYVGNVVLGQHNKPSAGTNGSGTGTLNIGANNLFDATSIVFAETVDSNANAIGNLNLSGGMLRAGTIDVSSGGNTNTANFNWTGGTLSVDYFGFDLLQNGSSTILAPGNSPGITTIDGDYTLASGTLQIEIVGTQYDQLIVNGDVSLAGALEVLLDGSGTGGATSLDDLYWIINNTGENDIVGEFSNFAEGEPVDIGGRNYYVYYHAQYGTSNFYGGNDLLLSTIPEPSTVLGLLTLAGMGLLGYPRRRRRNG